MPGVVYIRLESKPPSCRSHGLSVYAVCVCNKVRLPGTGQSAHVIGGSRFTRPASNLTELRLLATVQQNTNFHSHFESLTVYKSTYFDYLRTSFKANVKFVVRKRNVWKGVLNKDDLKWNSKVNIRQVSSAYAGNLPFTRVIVAHSCGSNWQLKLVNFRKFYRCPWDFNVGYPHFY